MLDDDDGVGLRTDGPLISLKTHEDSQSGGMVQRGKVSQGLNPALQVSICPCMGAKHRANHHMSYVYACPSKHVMHTYENMSLAFFPCSSQGSLTTIMQCVDLDAKTCHLDTR